MPGNVTLTMVPDRPKEQIKIIRKIVKTKVPTVSVKTGKGTAWGWVNIRGSQHLGMFTDNERKALIELGLAPGGNFAVLPPEDRKWFIQKHRAQTIGVLE